MQEDSSSHSKDQTRTPLALDAARKMLEFITPASTAARLYQANTPYPGGSYRFRGRRVQIKIEQFILHRQSTVCLAGCCCCYCCSGDSDISIRESPAAATRHQRAQVYYAYQRPGERESGRQEAATEPLSDVYPSERAAWMLNIPCDTHTHTVVTGHKLEAAKKGTLPASSWL